MPLQGSLVAQNATDSQEIDVDRKEMPDHLT